VNGKLIRMRRLFRQDERTVVVALDHGQYKGSIHGLNPLEATVRQVVEAGADGIILNPGAADAGIESYAGSSALILRLTGASTDHNPCFDFHRTILSVDAAVAAGADAVIAMGFVGGEGEAKSLRQLAKAAGDCRHWGMPLIAEMLISAPDKFHDPSWIKLAARVAYELGADAVKVYGASEEGFAEVICDCPIPVLVAGGPGGGDPVAMARKAILDGAAGVAFGRSVFGAVDPASVVRGLVEVVHEGEGGIRGNI